MIRRGLTLGQTSQVANYLFLAFGVALTDPLPLGDELSGGKHGHTVTDALRVVPRVPGDQCVRRSIDSHLEEGTVVGVREGAAHWWRNDPFACPCEVLQDAVAMTWIESELRPDDNFSVFPEDAIIAHQAQFTQEQPVQHPPGTAVGIQEGRDEHIRVENDSHAPFRAALTARISRATSPSDIDAVPFFAASARNLLTASCARALRTTASA